MAASSTTMKQLFPENDRAIEATMEAICTCKNLEQKELLEQRILKEVGVLIDLLQASLGKQGSREQQALIAKIKTYHSMNIKLNATEIIDVRTMHSTMKESNQHAESGRRVYLDNCIDTFNSRKKRGLTCDDIIGP